MMIEGISMKRRIERFLLLTAVLLVIWCTPVFAEENTIVDSGSCGESVVWELDDQGILIISGIGEMEDYTWTNFVPTTPWYEYRYDIKGIIVEDGVTSIGDCSFYKLSNVTQVDLSNDVIVIGSYAFGSCYKITSIDLPDNLEYIAGNCFDLCNALTELEVPESVHKLGAGAFSYCENLKSVKLPSKIQTLPNALFYKSVSLESVQIPQDVITIPYNCFGECEGLKYIGFPDALETIEGSAFYNCKSLESMVIPDTVTVINGSAFYGCSGLTKLKLPKNISKIPANLCYGCIKLESVEIPASVTDIGEMAFYNCRALKEAVLYERIKRIGKSAFYNCVDLNTIVFPESVSSIGAYAAGFYTDIFDEPNQLTPNTKIYCYEGTKAEEYVKAGNLDYSIINISLDSSEYDYTGKEIIPDITVTIDGESLVKDRDYVVEYKNNVEIGTAVAEISFINDYSEINAVVPRQYEIGKLINTCIIKLDKEQYPVGLIMPIVTVTYNDEKLILNENYRLTYELGGDSWIKPGEEYVGCINEAGIGTITVTGIGEFIGQRELTFEAVEVKEITLGDISIPRSRYKYTGKAITPEVTVTCNNVILEEGKDYTLRYENNIEAGTASIIVKGIEKYKGFVSKQFEIAPIGIEAVLKYGNLLRLAGSNRYATSVKASDMLMRSLGEEEHDNIIVACGTDYPDALTGSYLAKVKDAPIVLVDDSAAGENNVKEYISNNLKSGGTVYILGGKGAVTERFEKSLSKFNVKRLAGGNRYDTNIAILKEAGVTDEDLLICTGEGFADSLSASAVGKPILLAAGSGVSSTQTEYLKTLEKGDVYLIGGTGAVSDKIGNQLKAYDKDGKVDRVSGANRYKTSVAVAEEFFPEGSEAAVFAYAQNFPDGLAGGPLAMSIDAPLLLVDNTGYKDAKAYAQEAGISKAIVLGGESLISDVIINGILK